LTDSFVGGAQRRPLILRHCARFAHGQAEIRAKDFFGKRFFGKKRFIPGDFFPLVTRNSLFGRILYQTEIYFASCLNMLSSLS